MLENTYVSPPQSPRQALKRAYLRRLLPALLTVEKNGQHLTFHQRFLAIRFAADMSLCRTAGRHASWSRALEEKWSSECRRSLNVMTKRRLTALRSRRFSRRRNLSGSNGTRSSTKGGYIGRLRPVVSIKKRLGRACRSRSVRRLSRSKATENRAMEVAALRERAEEEEGATKGDMEEVNGLRDVIPGASQIMDEAIVLQEAAHYILSLQAQVQALQSLTQSVYSCC